MSSAYNKSNSKNRIQSETNTLKERALHAWVEERPLREAVRLQKRAKLLEEFKQRVSRLLDDKIDIQVGIDGNGQVSTTIDGVTLVGVSAGFGSVSILLVETCSRCRAKVPSYPIKNLADLGQAISRFEEDIEFDRPLAGHNCSVLAIKINPKSSSPWLD